MTIDERLERAAKAGLLRDLLATGFTGFDIDAVWQEIKEGTRQELCNNARCIIEAWQQDAPEVEITNCEDYGGSPRCTLYRNQYGCGECILELGWSKDQSRDSNPYCMNIGPRCPGEGTCVLTPKLQQKGGG